ncbi:hypothetical protein [Limnohabitans sp. Jir72]|uniref:hypothetical protein n=1 Tax=Limnohabitans sp. Jir72 TaxID=1977909 RepID=UPI0011B2111D|nr:hypothetical protein [Limnohabitans sp. Jir72]
MRQLTLSTRQWLAALPLTRMSFLSDAQLLSAIAGNNGSFRSAIFSLLRLAKRTARQSMSAASIAAAIIQQAAAKK